MNEDLDAIADEIEKRKETQLAAVSEADVPVINFDKKTEDAQPPATVDRATELIETAFNQAVVHKVQTDETVQEELLETADTVIHNKMNTIKSRADQEDKETHFNNKKGACECFGYNETTTEKWAVNVMNFWHNIMTAIWLFIGFFTFAPVTFVAKKIVVIFKKSWLAVVIAILLYLAVVSIPVVVGFLTSNT